MAVLYFFGLFIVDVIDLVLVSTEFVEYYSGRSVCNEGF